MPPVIKRKILAFLPRTTVRQSNTIKVATSLATKTCSSTCTPTKQQRKVKVALTPTKKTALVTRTTRTKLRKQKAGGKRVKNNENNQVPLIPHASSTFTCGNQRKDTLKSIEPQTKETTSVTRTTRSKLKKQKETSKAEAEDAVKNEKIQDPATIPLRSTSTRCNKEETTTRRRNPLEEIHHNIEPPIKGTTLVCKTKRPTRKRKAREATNNESNQVRTATHKSSTSIRRNKKKRTTKGEEEDIEEVIELGFDAEKEGNSNESNQAPTTARKRSTSARRSRSKQQKATKKEDPIQRLSSNINSAAIETKSVKRTTRAERRKQKSGAEEQGGNNNENIQPLSSTLLSSTSIGCNKEEVSAQREEPLQENHHDMESSVKETDKKVEVVEEVIELGLDTKEKAEKEGNSNESNQAPTSACTSSTSTPRSNDQKPLKGITLVELWSNTKPKAAKEARDSENKHTPPTACTSSTSTPRSKQRNTIKGTTLIELWSNMKQTAGKEAKNNGKIQSPTSARKRSISTRCSNQQKSTRKECPRREEPLQQIHKSTELPLKEKTPVARKTGRQTGNCEAEDAKKNESNQGETVTPKSSFFARFKRERKLTDSERDDELVKNVIEIWMTKEADKKAKNNEINPTSLVARKTRQNQRKHKAQDAKDNERNQVETASKSSTSTGRKRKRKLTKGEKEDALVKKVMEIDENYRKAKKMAKEKTSKEWAILTHDKISMVWPQEKLHHLESVKAAVRSDEYYWSHAPSPITKNSEMDNDNTATQPTQAQNEDDRIELLVLSESHAFTSERALLHTLKKEHSNKDEPSGHLNLVHSLSYGEPWTLENFEEKKMVDKTISGGTPVFWHLLATLGSTDKDYRQRPDEDPLRLDVSKKEFSESFADISGSLKTTRQSRIDAKRNILHKIKEKNIMFADVSPVAIYLPSKTVKKHNIKTGHPYTDNINKMKDNLYVKIIHAAWNNYASPMIFKLRPKRVIILGKRIERLLGRDVLEAHCALAGAKLYPTLDHPSYNEVRGYNYRGRLRILRGLSFGDDEEANKCYEELDSFKKRRGEEKKVLQKIKKEQRLKREELKQQKCNAAACTDSNSPTMTVS